MSPDSYISSIGTFGGGMWRGGPRGWMACEGQSMTIKDHAALYSIIGTMYGGDGTATFKLPDLRAKDEHGAPQPWGQHPVQMICIEGTYPSFN
jgi:microcystin-dependent protein